MRYRKFGRLGWQVSELGFGAWAIGGGWGQVDDREAVTTLHTALDAGINFIDTAQVYGDGHSEQLVGRVLKERGGPGERIYVATKIPPRGKLWWTEPEFDDLEQFYTPEYLRERVELSLRRLGVEAIDLMQLHTWTRGFNKHTSWSDTFNVLVEEGKLLGFGISASEKRPEDVTPLLEAGRIDAVQVIYNLFEQRTGKSVLEPALSHELGVIVRVPLDEGSLTGKFTDQTTFASGDFRRHFFRGNNLRATVRRVEEIRSFKEQNFPELSMVELALRFCTSHPAASTTIVGVRNRDQLRGNLRVTELDHFSPEQLRELERFAWTREFWSEEVSA